MVGADLIEPFDHQRVGKVDGHRFDSNEQLPGSGGGLTHFANSQLIELSEFIANQGAHREHPIGVGVRSAAWNNENVPVEPPVSRYDFPDPRDARGDLVAIGGDLRPGTLLAAYRAGIFPMVTHEGELGWWSPEQRAILLPGDIAISRSLGQSVRRFRVSVNESFESVIEGCADPTRPGGWITPEFVSAYSELHGMGWAHSIEVWDREGTLVGGLYGVGIGGLFAGESMFHRARDASKVALVHLAVVMSGAESAMIDVQWQTPHLETLGCQVIGRGAYLDRLPELLAFESPFTTFSG